MRTTSREGRRTRSALVAACSALVLSFSLAACGASDQGAQGSGTLHLDEATSKHLDEIEKRPTQISVTEPVGAVIPKGKRVAAAICSYPSCKNMAVALRAGAQALGWEFIEVPTDLSPQGTKTSWQQMLRKKPDAIINLSQPRKYFEPELAEAKKAGIAVVNSITADTEGGDGIDFVAYGPSKIRQVGTDMADWIARDSDGKAHALVVNMPQADLLNVIAKSFDARFKTSCEGCKVERLDVSPTDIGNELNTKVVSFLRAHPDVNYVMAGYQDMIQGLPSALRAAGKGNVKVMANGGLQPDAAAYLREGKPMVAFYAYAGTQATWHSLDWLARHFAGADTAPAEKAAATVWLARPKTTPDQGAPNLVADYESQFKKLWSVG